MDGDVVPGHARTAVERRGRPHAVYGRRRLRVTLALTLTLTLTLTHAVYGRRRLRVTLTLAPRP